jgi:hypothetical protein
VTGLEDDPDLAVRLEPDDPGTVPRTWVDDYEGAPPRIDGDAFRRDDPNEPVIHRALQRSPIDDKLRLVAEHSTVLFWDVMRQRHMQRSKDRRCSITSSARASSVGLKAASAAINSSALA